MLHPVVLPSRFTGLKVLFSSRLLPTGRLQSPQFFTFLTFDQALTSTKLGRSGLSNLTCSLLPAPTSSGLGKKNNPKLSPTDVTHAPCLPQKVHWPPAGPTLCRTVLYFIRTAMGGSCSNEPARASAAQTTSVASATARTNKQG